MEPVMPAPKPRGPGWRPPQKPPTPPVAVDLPDDDAERYPERAGYKVDGTSREAADSVDASGLRALVMEDIAAHGATTADECAARLNRTVLSIRPRFSELRLLNLIMDTGKRRRNVSGKRAVVWCRKETP